VGGFEQIGPGLLVLVGIFLIGLGTGIFLRRGGVRTARAEAQRLGNDLDAARAQLADAGEQLAAARRELESQRTAVAKHFERTSDLFRDLTHQYTALYAHLAEGARELCPEQRIPLASGFSAPPIGIAPDGAARGDEELASREQAEAQLAAVRRAAERIAEPGERPVASPSAGA
jgi:uncharacterized membrane-anchored protein YhcB (DUF1043 family)